MTGKIPAGKKNRKPNGEKKTAGRRPSGEKTREKGRRRKNQRIKNGWGKDLVPFFHNLN